MDISGEKTQERKYGISDLYILIKGPSIVCFVSGKMTRICYVKFRALVIRMLCFLKVNRIRKYK